MKPVRVYWSEDPDDLTRRHYQAHLRAWRIENGLSQREAAALTGIPRGTWSCWECGARKPHPKYRAVLKRDFDIPFGSVQRPKQPYDNGPILRTFEDLEIDMPF